MFVALLSLAVGFLILWVVELLYRQKRISNEVSRKTIHVVSGIILIIWIFSVSRGVIIFTESLFVLAVLVARKLRILGSQYGVNRFSFGEVFFPIGVIVILLLGVPTWVFVVAISHLAFADTAAALFGIPFGVKNSYYVFGQKKSVVGTSAFFATSVLIIAIASHWLQQQGLGSTRLLPIPFLATAVENLGIYGADNLLIPLSIGLLLR